MLKNLILPLHIYRVRAKMHVLQSQIKKMESAKYLNLQARIEVAQLKKMLIKLQEQETALHFPKLQVS